MARGAVGRWRANLSKSWSGPWWCEARASGGRPAALDIVAAQMPGDTRTPPRGVLYGPIEWQGAGPGYEDILYEKADGIAKITINRPERRNAFRPPTLAELRDAFTKARDDLEVGAIIFTGAGDQAFCSGGDQKIRGDDGYIGSDEVASKGIGRLDVATSTSRSGAPRSRSSRRWPVRGRRRPHPAPRVRSDDRRRERDLRPDRAAGRQLRRRLRGRLLARQVGVKGRRRSGTCAASTTPTRRSTWARQHRRPDRSSSARRSPGAAR